MSLRCMALLRWSESKSGPYCVVRSSTLVSSATLTSYQKGGLLRRAASLSLTTFLSCQA